MDQEKMNGSHNISAISAGTVKTPFYPDAFAPKACHENGVTLADGDQNVGPGGGNRNSPARRVDKGFETFMMTGDMIIRTSPHHKIDSPEKRLKIAADGDGVENAGIVTPSSPKRSSKIPKPVGGSPKSAARTPPRTLPKSNVAHIDVMTEVGDCSNEKDMVQPKVSSSQPVVCSDPVVDPVTEVVDQTGVPEAVALPEPVATINAEPVATVQKVRITSAPTEHVQLMPRVSVAEISSPEVETTTMVLKEAPAVPSAQTKQDVEMTPAEPSHRVMPLENVGILGVPRYADVPVPLDIPPDDISSEDEKYRHDDLIDVDELPPPPDELLQDLGVTPAPPRRDIMCDDHIFIHQNSAPPPPVQRDVVGAKIQPGARVKRNSSDSEADRMQDGPGSSSERNMTTSQSAEKLVHCARGNPSPIGSVRNSKSHENYLESNMNGGLTVVSIAFDDSLASSVDVLHYEQSSAGSEDSLRQEDALRSAQSRSLNSSPEKKCECVAGDKMHTFIMLDEPSNIGVVKKPRSVPEVGRGASPPERVEGHTNGTTDPGRQRVLSDVDSAQQGSIVVHTDRRTDGDLAKRNTNYSNSSSAYTSPRAASEPTGAIIEGRSDAELARHDEAVAKSYEVAASASSPRRSPCSSSPTDGASGPLNDIPANSTALADATDSGDWDVHSVYHQPVKEVDRPSAARLAKRLYNLEGFQRVDVARHLSKRNDFAYLVGDEYLKYFDLKDLSLDAALRRFLKRLTLTGETQECERILAHFSNHFVHCNKGVFNSEDACHTLTCALMLLNTDLHTQTTGRRMTLSEFIDNLADLNDGENFPKEVLKNLYHAIKTEPLQFDLCSDDTDTTTNLGATNAAAAVQSSTADTPRHMGHNPFLEVPDPAKATEYKKGYVMRKCCVNADGRHTPMGKRGWKMFYATLRDTVLYLHKDEHGFKRCALTDHMSNAIRVHHALATKATDYKKKQHVFRLKTADWAQYLFQTSDSRECQEWIDTINYVAAMLSAPPLPSAIGSQKKFQRPLLPSSYTKLNMREQLQHHENMAAQLEQELKEHRRNAPDKGSKSRTIQQYCEKESYLQYELKRFKMYSFLMQARMTTYPELEPSLVEIAIGEVDEPPASPPADSHMAPIYPAATTVAVSPRSRDNRVVQRSQSDSSEDATDTCDITLEETRL